MAEETSFYSDDRGVRITDKRVIIENTTYSLANITSVSTNVENPSIIGPVITMLVGGLLLLAGFDSPRAAGMGIMFGVLVGAIGYVWLRGCKPSYHLRIGSASGESTPLKSLRKDWIEGIARAINEAIIHRA